MAMKLQVTLEIDEIEAPDDFSGDAESPDAIQDYLKGDEAVLKDLVSEALDEAKIIDVKVKK